jgi:hypothetical protein
MKGMKNLSELFGLSILLLFLIGSVSAVDMGLTPSKMELKGNTGEQICGNFTLSTTMKALYLSVEDKWTDTGNSKNLTDYTKLASDYTIESNYVEDINLSGKKKFEFCITAKKPGIYNGVLIFRSSTIAGLGMWVKAEIGGMDLEEKEVAPITGATVGESGINKYLWPLLISTIVSLIALVLLIRYSKRMKKNKEEKNEEESKDKSDWDEEEED